MARQKTPGRFEDLLAAGERTFAAHGFDAATIGEIASQAGVGKGTFYLYFRSKSELLDALRRRFADELAAAVAAHPNGTFDGDWTLLLRDRLNAAATHFSVAGQRHEILFHPEPGDSTADNAWTISVVASLEELILGAISAGQADVTDPHLTAVALFHALYGLFHNALHDPASNDQERVVTAGWTLMSRTLGLQQASRPKEPSGPRKSEGNFAPLGPTARA